MKVAISKLKKFHVSQLGEYACGLACLSTISKYHGGEVTQEKLRDVSGTTMSGTTLLGLIQAAAEIGLEAKGFEAEVKHLKEQESPVILHVVMDKVREHYIVCFGFDGERFWLSDPGVGIVSMNETDLMNIWKSSILLQVNPTEKFQTQKIQSNSKMDWFKSLIAEDIPILLVATVLGTLMAVTGLSTAIFSQKLIDDFLPNQTYDKAILGVVALGLLLLFRSLLGYFQGVFMARQGRDLNIRIVSSFIGKILHLPMKYFKGFSTGDLIARMNDSLRIKNTVSLITGTVIINLLVVVVSLVFVFYQSAIIGWLCVAGSLAFLFVGWRYHRPIIAKQKEVMAAHALNETQYIDSLTGIQVLRSYGREDVFRQRIDQVYTHYQTKGYDLAILGNNFSFFTQIIVAVFTSLLFGMGVYLVFQQNLQLGELMALIQVGSSIIPAVAGLVVANIQFQEAKVAFDRMHEIAGLKEEDQTIPESTSKTIHAECLMEVDQVMFRYPGRSPILKGVSFELHAGQTTALFAPVGTGKSTLVDLIQRFYIPEQGSVQMPFLGIGEISLKHWRDQLGVVNQKEKLFNSSVLDNIALSNTQEELEATARLLQELGWWDMFAGLPQGVLTLCGEDGRNLSGGQRQLVGLARAIVRKPKILILDEATSAMDYGTERKVQTLVRDYVSNTGASLLLITHQPTLAASTDKVMILEQGQISAYDTAGELLQSDNLLSRTYQNMLEPNWR
ncbi:peptidase domain-containing ABC transporter [Belliella kenyensis]|uniref:Peptidase domain-containing ABC transporter n=1 Tax=Belliella kenyensis TaxID=1472724 RepID=A0ABV8EHH6_9BACT|nr:peptidase domain-containing ABC transporter [Belliella kenyensis]MCH7400939.1 peptidase domain-containing ABC transporter [Belliella kenyensis]MDN3603938.1 peptidase domain-containing ABC transporter [Belliella kenyensis]